MTVLDVKPIMLGDWSESKITRLPEFDYMHNQWHFHDSVVSGISPFA